MCGGRKVAPYFVLSAVIYTFWSFGIMECNSVYSKIEPVLGGVDSVASFITVNEQWVGVCFVLRCLREPFLVYFYGHHTNT